MTPTALLPFILELLVILLLIVWWVRWSPRGLAWAVVSVIVAIGLSYLSGLVFRVPPYQAGCEEICPGWMGYPEPTHRILAGDIVTFDAPSFVRNTFFYYAVFLAYSAVAARLARHFHMSERPWTRWMVFVLFVIVIPLASLPLWLPPPQPSLDIPDQRLANNAARDWRWQLRLRGWMDRRLALEDIRSAPDGVGQRVCFRVYTWFYLPYKRVYIDLDEAGLRARDGGEIPLSQSCFENRSGER